MLQVAHQLMWNLETNMYTDEEGEERDPVMYDKLLPVRKNIEDLMSVQVSHSDLPPALSFVVCSLLFTGQGLLRQRVYLLQQHHQHLWDYQAL